MKTAKEFFHEWALDNTNTLPIKSFKFAEDYAKDREEALKKHNSLEALFQEHLEFCRSKFPDSTWVSSLRGLEREIKEVEEESTIGYEAWIMEYVDCMMYLIDSMDRGPSMNDFKFAFKRKIGINKGRNWKQNKDGSYSHKRDNY